MIDALAHAGKVFKRPNYIARARKAADFLLEHAIDNEGNLKRIYAAGAAQFDATLEDYAMLIRGLLSLYKATPEETLLESAVSLMQRAEELFHDAPDRGYFFMHRSDNLLMRLKSGDDGAIPNANAIMLHNLVDLFVLTKDPSWRGKAKAQASYFLAGNTRILAEFATMLQAALRLEEAVHGKTPATAELFTPVENEVQPTPDDVVAVTAALTSEDEVRVTLSIKEGWHINAGRVQDRFLIPTQLDVQGNNVDVTEVIYPEPQRGKASALPVYAGQVSIVARLKPVAEGSARGKLRVLLRFQPCHDTTCHAVRDISLTV
jgi:uncharacterized protein YyaL (SSP411 family)